mmetsp:Transcript_23881/g.39492  ORF Transcript_23881/g.39492 Transcript_23881/m.39492 type:complete len:156 (-) Transcript_23881:316-783(-)
MEAGLPAIILLAICSLLGLLSGVLATSKKCLSNAAARVLIHSVATATVAGTFWLWALWKVIVTHDPDLGALSFALVLFSCYNEYKTAMRGDGASCQKKLLCLATAVIVSNYTYALSLPLGSTLRLYMMLGAAYWTAAGLWGVYLLGQLQSSNLPF